MKNQHRNMIQHYIKFNAKFISRIPAFEGIFQVGNELTEREVI